MTTIISTIPLASPITTTSTAMLSVKTSTISTADLSAKDATMINSTISSDLSPSYSPTDASSSVSSSSSSASSTTSNIVSRPSTPIKSRPLTPPTPPSQPIIHSPKKGAPRTNHHTTPISTTKKISFYSSNQDNFLQLIEPFPVSPPTYDTLPPGGCPKFPIMTTHTLPHQDMLPSYSPSIYKIGIVARKMEWLTPFEPSPSRSWKYIIMELNSTQLNFYSIPNTLENHLLSFKPIPQTTERTYNQFEEMELRNLMSDFTRDDDLQFFKFCQRLNLIDPAINSSSSASFSSSSNSKSNKKLLRSYSLQHAKLGLAVDYKKRPNVLRLRIESEQILLNFLNTKDLIDWNMAINVGKDIALDLNDRELPKYRTVPRRRRRNSVIPSAYNSGSNGNGNGNSNDQLIHQVLNKRLRSHSDPNNKLRGKLAKLKFKFGGSSSSIKTSSSTSIASSPLASSSTSSPRSMSAPINSTASNSTNTTTTTTTSTKLEPIRSNSVPTFSIYSESEYEDESAINSTFEEDDFDDDEEEDIDTYELISRATDTSKKARIRANTIPTIMTTSPTANSLNSQTSSTSTSHSTNHTTSRSHSSHIDYEEEDIQNLSDLHHDEDDEEEEDEEDEFQADDGVEEDINPSAISESRPSLSSSSHRPSLSLPRFDDEEDYKWNPTAEKTPSRRRYYKNCLRCIKPLTMEDSWVAKSLVRPTSISPLNYAYLKHVKYNTPVTIGGQESGFTNTNLFSPASNSSLVSLNSSIFSSPSTTSLNNYNYSHSPDPISNGGSSSKSSSFSSRKPRSFSFKELNGFSLPDSVLTKVPNHFLKEYLVGTHGLIPKEL